MKKYSRITSSALPYYITTRCIYEKWFEIPMHEVWHIFCDYLYLVKFAFELEIHAFVLTDKDFHMLLSTPKGNLGPAMNYFLREVSKEITRRANRINQTFGHTFHSSLISSPHHYMHAYKYIYRKAIEISEHRLAEKYEYSTLGGLLGLNQLLIPVCFDKVLFTDVENTLEWINREYRSGDKDKVRKALKKKIFKFAPNRSDRKLDEPELILS